MIIEDIKKHLETKCQVLYGKNLNINCLGEKSGNITLKSIPCNEIVKEYADGGSLRQYVFEICLRTALDTDMKENTATANFMENLKNWFCFESEAQKMEFSLKKAVPLEYEVLATHGVSHMDRSGAEHSIRVRLIYEQE